MRAEFGMNRGSRVDAKLMNGELQLSAVVNQSSGNRADLLFHEVEALVS